MEAWKARLEDILEEHFPKLNEDDVSKPSPNNRSAALVMFAETVALIKDLLQEKDIEWVEEMIHFLSDIKPANKVLKDKIAQLRKTRDEYWKEHAPDSIQDDAQDEGGDEIMTE